MEGWSHVDGGMVSRSVVFPPDCAISPSFFLGQSVEKNKQVVNCSGIIFKSGRH